MIIKWRKRFPYIEKISIIKLYHKFKKPLFIYSVKNILKKIKKFKTKKGLEIFYAVKANYNGNIIKLIKDQGLSFETVSIDEMKYLINNQISPNKIALSGVCKTPDTIKYAIKQKIKYINVDSLDELKYLQIYKNSETINILRLNLNINADSNNKITTGKINNKFGIWYKYVLNYIKKINKKIKIKGIGFHLGSQIENTKYYKEAMIKIRKIIDKLKKFDINIKVLNIGGGIGINYFGTKLKTLLIERIIKTAIKITKIKKIIIEPGRSIIGDSCITIGKVIYIKKNPAKCFAVTNIGMNIIPRPAIYNSFHLIENTQQRKRFGCFDIVGPICESSDFIGKKRKLNIKKKDLLIIHDTGAYCMSMKTNYNMQTKPVEVLIKKNYFKII